MVQGEESHYEYRIDLWQCFNYGREEQWALGPSFILYIINVLLNTYEMLNIVLGTAGKKISLEVHNLLRETHMLIYNYKIIHSSIHM